MNEFHGKSGGDKADSSWEEWGGGLQPLRRRWVWALELDVDGSMENWGIQSSRRRCKDLYGNLFIKGECQFRGKVDLFNK